MELILPFKPLSYNAYYRNSRTGKRIKTGKGLAFDEELNIHLKENAIALAQFGKSIDPSSNIVKLTIRVGNPNFFIKDGSRISKTAGDVDNYLKVMQDKIFGFIGVDDYVARHLDILDIPSVEPFTKIILKTIPIHELPTHLEV